MVQAVPFRTWFVFFAHLSLTLQHLFRHLNCFLLLLLSPLLGKKLLYYLYICHRSLHIFDSIVRNKHCTQMLPWLFGNIIHIVITDKHPHCSTYDKNQVPLFLGPPFVEFYLEIHKIWFTKFESEFIILAVHCLLVTI